MESFCNKAGPKVGVADCQEIQCSCCECCIDGEDGCPDKFSWSYRHSQGWPSTGPRKPWEQIGMEGAKVWDHHLKAWHDKVARDAKEKEEKEAEEAAKKAAEEAGAPAAEPVS